MKYSLFDINFFFKKIQQKGFFHLLSANVLIQVFAFASQLFVAGILSPDDIGRIKIIQSYLSIFSIIAGMGFNASTLKICSENKTHKENTDFFNSALIFTLISSLTVYITILTLNAFQIFSTDILIKWLIPLGLFPLISNSFFTLYISYFQASKEIKLLSSLIVYSKLLSIIAVIALTFYWGIEGYYYAYNVSFILMLSVVVLLMRKFVKFSFDFKIGQKFKEHWNYARPNVMAGIISEVSGLVDIILISFMIKDMYEIGYYGFALTLTIALRIFPTTVQQITIPYFSSFNQNKEEFLKIFNKYNRMLHLVVMSSLIVFIILMPIIIQLIFGPKYDKSFFYLIFLSIGWSIRNLNHLQSGAIFGLGKIKYNAYTVLFVLIGNVIIYPIAINLFGINGAAYASISSGLIFLIASRYFFNKAVKNTIWKN